MATVNGLTAERMQEIIDATIVDAEIVGNDLILTLYDGSTINAGVAKGTFLSPFSGTHAALAASNPVAELGQVIKPTDAPQEFRIGDGVTPYLNLPSYFADRTPQIATTATPLAGVPNTGADWPGLTVTFTSDGIQPWKVTAKCANATGESTITAGTLARLAIYEGATLLDLSDGSQTVSAGAAARSSIPSVIVPKVFSAGVHTLKVTCSRVGGAGTWLFNAGVGFEAKLIAEPI